MTTMITRQNRTADGLRKSLFDCLDAVIAKEISSKEVECVCAISEQIIQSAKLELSIELEREKVLREKRDYDREQLIISTGKLVEVSESLKMLEHDQQ